MPLWKLSPAAAADDARWLDYSRWREVIVRAPSAAMARVIAGQLDRNPDTPHLGNESLDFRSGFDDEKLYWVEELSAQEAARHGDGDGPEGIVESAR